MRARVASFQVIAVISMASNTEASQEGDVCNQRLEFCVQFSLIHKVCGQPGVRHDHASAHKKQ